MKTNKTMIVVSVAAGLVALGLVDYATAGGAGRRDSAQKSSEASVSTNDNGSVSKTFTEMTVTTNGNMVTERRRETRTTTDADGNMLATSTSEYAQSYPVGDEGLASITTAPCGVASDDDAAAETAAEGFMGLKFGEKFAGTNLVADASEPTLLQAKFTPKKTLAGFDDYYVYVTPKTHRVVKVYACAKEAVEAGASWRRHYLIEALEKKYHTWARPRSWCRPIYSFDIGGGRFVTACLAGASRDYETVLAAWDDALLTAAADETEELRDAARREASERRNRRVNEAADAF